jgi:hypothetical protein
VSAAVVIHYEMRMCRTALSSVVCPALPYFEHCLKNDTIFRKNVIEYKMFYISLHILSITFLILRRIRRDIINLRTKVFAQSTRHSYQILIKLEFS